MPHIYLDIEKNERNRKQFELKITFGTQLPNGMFSWPNEPLILMKLEKGSLLPVENYEEAIENLPYNFFLYTDVLCAAMGVSRQIDIFHLHNERFSKEVLDPFFIEDEKDFLDIELEHLYSVYGCWNYHLNFIEKEVYDHFDKIIEKDGKPFLEELQVFVEDIETWSCLKNYRGEVRFTKKLVFVRGGKCYCSQSSPMVKEILY